MVNILNPQIKIISKSQIYNLFFDMIPPRTKSFIRALVTKYVSPLEVYRNSNPVVMVGQTKFDRVDQKVLKQSSKLNTRQINASQGVKLQGNKKKYQKRKPAITYRSYTVEFKKKLVQRINDAHKQTGYPLSKIIRSKARQLNIHPKNIFRWFNTKQIKKKQGGRKAKYPQMERRLAQFILNNPKMKRKQILRQAQKIMEDMSIPGRQYFNFSKGWYQRFRQRMVRRKILPAKMQAKSQSNSIKEQWQSDFSSSQSSVKKQEYEIGKDQYDYVKVENWDQSYADSEISDDVKIQSDWEDSDQQYKIKYAHKQQHTKVNDDPFIMIYDDQIFDFKQDKYEKQEKIEKWQKIQDYKLQAKYEQKTVNGQINESFQIPSNESKNLQISIFASDEQQN